ncbi:amino acid-binding protein [Vulcanisaeta souniana]|uniref:Uncharacterized protein n=1 Tax=Vulcanisaeta souniana JCM 11219 TaxID=1293586 RepID=A0A830EEU1_9CREN|nr:amino acid-binding protein [Vulcanisaeta souniana]GGI69793.1 hypothetical protein GCM10007112_03490 [Vulcanisaeta souniana JCM 11219]
MENLTLAINELVTEGVELINVINESVMSIAFSRKQFISALKSVLQQVGVQALNSTLYRIGYEYARAVATEMPMGDPVSTISTYLYTATAYNRLAFRGLEIRNNEVRVEFEEPFDEELDGSFTEGYIHGLINTAPSRLHYINIEKFNNIYRAVVRPIESIEPI